MHQRAPGIIQAEDLNTCMFGRGLAVQGFLGLEKVVDKGAVNGESHDSRVDLRPQKARRGAFSQPCCAQWSYC
ncbi:hypothetical protein V3F56_05970 [Moorellaceae bacterium AZ2]